MSTHNICFCKKKTKYELVHDKTYKTCATSKDSDQPAHSCSLIRVFVDHMCLRRPLGYSKRSEEELLPYRVDVQADLSTSLCWSHRSIIVGFVMPWLILCG